MGHGGPEHVSSYKFRTLAWIFTKKIPHCMKNHKLRLMKFWNLKNYLKLGVCGIKTIGPKHSPTHKSRTLTLIFTKKRHFIQNFNLNKKQQIFKKTLSLGFRAWKLVLGQLGPKHSSGHKFRTLALVLTKKALFHQEF